MPQDVLSLEGSVLGNMQAAFIFIVALNIRSLLSKLVPGRTSHKIGHTHTERVIVFFLDWDTHFFWHLIFGSHTLRTAQCLTITLQGMGNKWNETLA